MVLSPFSRNRAFTSSKCSRTKRFSWSVIRPRCGSPALLQGGVVGPASLAIATFTSCTTSPRRSCLPALLVTVSNGPHEDCVHVLGRSQLVELVEAQDDSLSASLPRRDVLHPHIALSHWQ